MKRTIAMTYRAVLYLLVLGCLAGAASGQEYKEYKQSSNRELLFELLFNRSRFGYSAEDGDVSSRFIFKRSDIKTSGHKIVAAGQLLFDSRGFHTSDRTFGFDEITDIDVGRSKVRIEGQDYTAVRFYTRSEDDRRTSRIRRGNVIEPHRTATIGEDEFIRGAVFSVTGDIEIYGEVSKDVISLFGDVFVGPDAVVRGDVVSMTGRIDLAHDASVYGEIRSGTDSRLGRRHRWKRFVSRYDEMVDYSFDDFAWYNRVDGFSFGVTATFADPDSVLPTVWAGAGYAFESARWRYHLGLEQTIIRRPALTVGGEAFRRLASDDDWLLSDRENFAFTTLFREDYKDYYEAEGGLAYLRIKPARHMMVESGFRYEETNWLDAERDLWSLFGGKEKFDPNFASVDSAGRSAGINQLDSSKNYALYGSFTYDTRDKDDPYYYSGVAVEAMAEWSNPDLGSDFDYSRYRLSVISNLRLNRRLMLIQRGVYGGSDGTLPMHRRFYLGGLGTLYGYEHKEFSGDYFWLVNVEYRVDFPHTDLAASLMWDVGQVAEHSNFDGSEVKHSLGAALYIGPDLKIGLARRLDRSYDNKPEFFARFEYSL